MNLINKCFYTISRFCNSISKLISIIILISFIITISLSSVIHSSIDFEFFYAQENVDSDTTDKFNLFLLLKEIDQLQKN